jgi:quinohemoprotein ethanol dehydrogenase
VDGRFVARDALTGKELWSFDLGGPSVAPPITFMANGKQYFAVTTGLTGPPANANSGHIRVNPRLQPKRLMVFALDGTAKVPEGAILTPEAPLAANFNVDPAKLERGMQVYNATCFLCHGPGVVSGGNAPDLRSSAIVLSNEALTSVVRDGILREKGMPNFTELSDDDIVAVQHYIRSKADKALAKQSQDNN